jgi:mono/diheme cytochrome c family protein
MAAFASLLVGCASSEPVVFQPPPDESYSVEQLAAGAEVYQRHCAVCHGATGAGRVGPNIVMVWERLTVDEERDVIVSGRRAMPAFSQTLDADQIEAVIAYTRAGWPVEE